MNPFVTIVIPTHDNLDMIRQVTAGIVANTREPFEMIIVDNASSKPEVLGFLGEVSGYPCACVLHLPVNRFYLSPNQKSVLFGSGWTPVELLMANGYYVEAAALAMVCPHAT